MTTCRCYKSHVQKPWSPLQQQAGGQQSPRGCSILSIDCSSLACIPSTISSWASEPGLQKVCLESRSPARAVWCWGTAVHWHAECRVPHPFCSILVHSLEKKKKNWIPQHGKQTTGQTTGSALAGIQHLAGNSSSQIHLAPSLLTFFFFWLLHKGCSALITLQLLWQRMGMLRSQRKAVELWAKGLPSP